MAETGAVRSSPAISALFSPLRVIAREVTADVAHVDALHPDERVGTESMGPRRLAEYASARAAARAALGELSATAPVLRGSAGEPSWPASVTGSISHTRGHCLAVAAVRHSVGTHHTIGVDIEAVARVNPAIERRILTAPERAVLDELDPDARQRFVATIFAAKEAFYKAHHQIESRFLGFDVVAIQVDPDGTLTFAPGPNPSAPLAVEPGETTSGRWMIEDGRVVAGVVIEMDGPVSDLPAESDG